MIKINIPKEAQDGIENMVIQHCLQSGEQPDEVMCNIFCMGVAMFMGVKTRTMLPHVVKGILDSNKILQEMIKGQG